MFVRPFLSMVIPTYTYSRDLEIMTEQCIASYIDQVDEMIIVEDGGMFSTHLQQLADVYIYHKDNRGFSKNLNLGWKIAQGEYVALVNSDTTLHIGDLRKLCIEGRVTSPLIVTQEWDGLAGPFWVAPDEVTKQYGYLDERMTTFYSDAEYNQRIKEVFLQVPQVQIYHEIAGTNKAVGIDTLVNRQKDEQILSTIRT